MPSIRLLLSLLVLAVAPVFAQGDNPFADDNPFANDGPMFGESSGDSTSSLLSSVKAIAPGQPFTLSLKLTHPAGWHSYFKNDGIGISEVPVLKWNLPEGFEAGELQWPIPHQAEFIGMTSFSYLDTNYFSATITPPADLPAGTEAAITLNATWQICEEGCKSEKAELKLTLPVKAGAEVDPEVVAELDKYAADYMPATTTPDDWKIIAKDDGKQITLRITTGAELSEDLFFYDYDAQVDPQKPQKWTSPETGVWELVVPRNQGNDISEDPGPVLKRLKGILSAHDKLPGTERYGAWIDVPFEAPEGATSSSGSSTSIGALLAILGGMFIGGMLLNLMPCVFPIIGIKIMGFVQQAGEDRRKITAHGIIFVLGVLISFWVLSGILLFLREASAGKAGEEVGWGYQLQNPWVVWSLLLLMFIMALNMFGIFELGTSATSVGGKLAHKQGVAGTFFSGVLATVVSTPCSAPFLGAAIGAAFALPPALFMLAFTFMALGLGAPYLILSIFPALIERLPRPGPWMESFKQAMSFLLFATAGFLLWVYVGQIDTGPMLKVVLGLTSLAVAFWVYGRWCVLSRPSRTRLIGAVVAVAFGLTGLYASKPPKKDNLWATWSPTAVQEALAEGRPVYVDFTAKWCLLCQVNKGRAYTDEVVQFFEENNVLLLKADKTNPDPTIEKELQNLGRTAIPVNVLYVPGNDTPHITKEVLSPDYLMEFAAELLPPKAEK